MNKQTLIYKGGDLHDDQIRITKAILKSSAMYNTICCPRQWGKSYYAIQLMLYYAINYPESQVMFATLSHRQGSKVFNQLMNGIQHTGIIKKKNSIENSIILINGSQIYFVSVQQPENLLGYSIDYLFVDEAALIKDETFERVLRPFLRVRGKKCFLFSTPRGQNYFYKYYNLGNNENEPYYISFKGDIFGNPYANMEEYESAKKSLPESIFKAEYLAEFVAGGTVFPDLDKHSTIQSWQGPKREERYFAGLDIALQGDYLVLTILNSKGEVVNCYRDTKKPMLMMAENVKKMLHLYNPNLTYVETNGIGNGGIFEILQKAHRSVTPFTTSNSSKQEIIEDLIFDLQNSDINIPTKQFFTYYIDEMTDYGFTYSPKTRKVVYNSISGHDDCVMSLALANKAKRSGKSRGQYLVDVG